MRVRHGVPWFPLDALKMGLYGGAPALSVHPERDDLTTAAQMWPMIRPMLENLMFDGRDYLVEGVNLAPDTVAAFRAERAGAVTACFLGYPEIDLVAKQAQVAAAAGQPNDWLNRMGEPYVARYLAGCRERSRRLRADCQRLALAFIDTGGDFDTAMAAAEHALLVD